MVPCDLSYEDSCRLFCKGIHQLSNHHGAPHVDFITETPVFTVSPQGPDLQRIWAIFTSKKSSSKHMDAQGKKK